MLADVVIDTNVLLHAQNPTEQRCAESLQLLQLLLEASTALCVDEGFAHDETLNRSHIGAEYLQKLRAGSFALEVIVALAARGRIRHVPRRAPLATAGKINQLLRNRVDRVFLSVAFNSTEKILVSHDYKDFQIPKRRDIASSLGVNVTEAGLCARCLQEPARAT
jgi:predicted nucleic acid-binding protein